MNVLSIPRDPPDETGAKTWFASEIAPHANALKGWLRARYPWLRDVDDVVQEAIFRLWRRKGQADRTPLQNPRAVLYRIARNQALDQARRNAIISFEAVTEWTRLPVLDEDDVVETVSHHQEMEFLADALRELPTRCRQVLTLTKIYGYTEREVAAQLGVSENTVRTQVVRGMLRCADYLRRHGVDRRRS